jgi:hypothetical protein
MLRTLSHLEQPEKLHFGLQNAAVVEELADESEDVVEMGVPHGVLHATVLARGVLLSRERNAPRIFFCRSYGYRVLGSTLQGRDDNDYPDVGKTRLDIEAPLPKEDGLYDVMMDISVNGSVDATITAFHPHEESV